MKEVLSAELARSLSSDPIRETAVPHQWFSARRYPLAIQLSNSCCNSAGAGWNMLPHYMLTACKLPGTKALRWAKLDASLESSEFRIIRIIRLRPFSNLHANESSCLLLLAFQCCCFRMLGAGFVSAFACPYKMDFACSSAWLVGLCCII